MKRIQILVFIACIISARLFAQNPASKPAQLKISAGLIEGTVEASGITSFKGIPFAKPPVGPLRWKAPQPLTSWTGIRKADKFAHNPMQKKVFGDMGFRSAGMSEDCLYLNVWTPAKTAKEKLPVLVYFYGGGFVAGDGSEARYDGENMAKKGIVTLTVNYRLGVFGFMAHPELSKESAQHSSGNYGLLDQNAALKWVKENISSFGGDPKRVTIAGESAGSISVSAQMASPLSKDLIAGAIGESGAMIHPTLAPIPLEQAEKNGVAFGSKAGAASLEALRNLPADQLLEEASKPGAFSTAANVDGYFLPKTPLEIFTEGKQALVPLLAGWNSAEVPFQALMWGDAPTPENYSKKIKQLYPDHTDQVLKLYPGKTQEEVIASATALASDRFIVYSTWKWLDIHHKTSGKPVYRYLFSKSKPGPKVVPIEGAGTQPAEFDGAPHAFEIEYAMGNLATNATYTWTADDRKISDIMLSYFANFIKTGNPNGSALPEWSPLSNTVQLMNIGINTAQEAEKDGARYLFLDQMYKK
ncbi:carboxylesterase/lipase family protein [Pedobacter metabolipauper]|uniref:Carboxylic ester hydrolase n=1 Tax=Pedobacter metabolipauper TaxID=425513 RepID=A0A4V3D1E3_9SPHI|nr:carboxylesterase family protein [Pedobacter metabolipauper]TDQ10287.1 para-nitrobenzyl esterase [Pedobacter metabolipauper]